MSDWAVGYRAALRDLKFLVTSRGLMTGRLALLLHDMEHDSRVIQHEISNREQKLRLVAGREAKIASDP